MPRVCSVSGKKSMSGNNRSHSLQATRRQWKANLQKVRVID
ncbi:MAG: 50S ribosomal protein L28, partial [Candidatus Izemoplasmatales bacterium]